MSSNSFAVSLGLSAIDGLLCAFVAVLVLALILIGPGTSSGAPDLTEAHIVRFDIIRTDQGADGIDLRLLISILAADSRDSTRPNVESRSTMLRLEGLNGHLQPGGDIMWRDCQVLAGHECLAFLVARKIKKGERWNIRLRVADSNASFTEGEPIYKVNAWIDSVLPATEAILTAGTGIEVCANWEKKSLSPHC